jgi:hypothetical protein
MDPRGKPYDCEYEVAMLALQGELSEALIQRSAELRLRAKEAVATSRRLRERCAALHDRVAEVLRTG